MSGLFQVEIAVLARPAIVPHVLHIVCVHQIETLATARCHLVPPFAKAETAAAAAVHCATVGCWRAFLCNRPAVHRAHAHRLCAGTHAHLVTLPCCSSRMV